MKDKDKFIPDMGHYKAKGDEKSLILFLIIVWPSNHPTTRPRTPCFTRYRLPGSQLVRFSTPIVCTVWAVSLSSVTQLREIIVLISLWFMRLREIKLFECTVTHRYDNYKGTTPSFLI